MFCFFRQGITRLSCVQSLAMASQCTMESRLVINNMHKTDWVPEAKEVDALVFMRVSKWDRNFVKFCTGKALSFARHSRRDVNVSFIEVLQKLRTTVVDEAITSAYASEDAEKKKSKRIRKAREADRDLAPAVLTMSCPEVRRGDLCVPGISIKVLFGIKNNDLWIEALPENLEYIRHGVLSSLASDQKGRA